MWKSEADAGKPLLRRWRKNTGIVPFFRLNMLFLVRGRELCLLAVSQG